MHCCEHHGEEKRDEAQPDSLTPLKRAANARVLHILCASGPPPSARRKHGVMSYGTEPITSAFTLPGGRARGLTTAAMRHPRFDRPHHGVRVPRRHRTPATFSNERVTDLARDYFPLLRQGEAFSHTTALLLLGVPILASAEIHTTALRPMGQARGKYVIGHRVNKQVLPVRSPQGFPCMPFTRALQQAAPGLPFRELVVALDHATVVRRRRGEFRPLVTRDELAQRLQVGRFRGAARLRAALEVSRVGAESRMESLQHFELAQLGIDDLELQAEILGPDGTWIGRFDAADRARRLLLEYDGEQHRTNRAQYLRDVRRLDLARDASFRVHRSHKEDFRLSRLPHTRKRLCVFLGRDPQPVPQHLVRYFAEPYEFP